MNESVSGCVQLANQPFTRMSKKLIVISGCVSLALGATALFSYQDLKQQRSEINHSRNTIDSKLSELEQALKKAKNREAIAGKASQRSEQLTRQSQQLARLAEEETLQAQQREHSARNLQDSARKATQIAKDAELRAIQQCDLAQTAENEAAAAQRRAEQQYARTIEAEKLAKKSKLEYQRAHADAKRAGQQASREQEEAKKLSQHAEQELCRAGDMQQRANRIFQKISRLEGELRCAANDNKKLSRELHQLKRDHHSDHDLIDDLRKKLKHNQRALDTANTQVTKLKKEREQQLNQANSHGHNAKKQQATINQLQQKIEQLKRQKS